MRKLLKNPIIISLLIFLALISLGIFTSGFIVRDRLDHIVYGNKFLQINKEYESEISVKNDNLSTITVHLKNPALENEGYVMFQILEDGNVIREVGFTGQNIGDPGDVKLKFEPISDSAKKVFQARLITEVNDPKLSVFVDDEDRLGGWFYNRDSIGVAGIFSAISSVAQRLFSDIMFLVMWVSSSLIVFFLYNKLKNKG